MSLALIPGSGSEQRKSKAASGAATGPDNPFVTIATEYKIAIMIYFLIWRLIPEAAQPFLPNAGDFGIEVARSIVAVAVEGLILWPILASRFGGTQTGWLHPLVLGSMIGLATRIIKAPVTLLNPLAALETQKIDVHALASGDVLLQAQLEVQFWQLLAMVCTYIGFTFFTARFASKQQRATPRAGQRFAMVYAGFAGMGMIMLALSGGVVEHMAILSQGRFRAFGELGIFAVPVKFLPILCVFWLLCRPASLRNPLFIGAMLLAAILQFIIVGSRSGLFTAGFVFLMAWVVLHRKLPALRIILIGLLATLSLGVLGELRQSGRTGEVNFSGVIDLGFAEAIEANRKEIFARQYNSGPVAISLSVPERQDHMLGATYIGGAAFFIPRSIWKEKPRGPGPTIVAMLFSNQSSAEGYRGKGVPAGGAGEAYLNFGYPGIIVIHLLFGVILKMIVLLAIARQTPVMQTMLIATGTILIAPTTPSIVPFLQTLVLLLASAWFVLGHRPQ